MTQFHKNVQTQNLEPQSFTQQATKVGHFYRGSNFSSKRAEWMLHSQEPAHRKCNPQDLLCSLDMCDCAFQVTTQDL